MKLRLTAITLILALLATAVLVPAGASANTFNAPVGRATSATAPNPLTAVPVSGTYTTSNNHQKGTFKGFLYVQHFADQSGKLVALGKLSGVFTRTKGNATRVVTGAAAGASGVDAASGAGNTPQAITNQAVTLPVSAATGSCPILHLDLGPLSLNLLGLQINLSRVVLDITAQPGPGNLLGNLLCAITNLLNGSPPLSNLTSLLNGLLGLLQPTTTANPFANIPVSGTLANGGTFAGLLNLTGFAVQNGQLIANGTLSGVLSSGKTVTNTPISSTVPTSATNGSSCQILHLDLAPTSLNLLGLQVNLSRVVLNIAAIPGAGNLLGNLLCSITNLLNPGGSLSTLASDLNRLLGLFKSPATLSSPLSAIPITGSGPGHTTFTGLFNLQNIADQGGKLVANGTLNGILSRATGGAAVVAPGARLAAPSAANSVPGLVTNQQVSIPLVGGTGGSCSILHLNLGPLSLNLLGLQIHLNKVVLDITAQSGPGNLLGNLLCAIANLLNPGGSLSPLVADLNGLLGLL